MRNRGKREGCTEPAEKKSVIILSLLLTERSTVQWTEDNLRILLNTVKEWRLLCHDEVEFEDLLGSANSALWKEVAGRVKEHKKVTPLKCQECFNQVQYIQYRPVF